MASEKNERVAVVLKQIPIDKIDVEEAKTRTRRIRAGLDDLKRNIENVGLLHPIVVFPKDDRYELVAGSRRLIAVTELGWEKIPATVLSPMDTTTAKIASISENIHRRDLPFRDMVDVCGYLFDQLNGDVNAVARRLNVSLPTVTRYVALRLTPEPIKKKIEAGQLSRKDAQKLVGATWPDKEKMESLANKMEEMTREEKDRMVDIAIERPEAPPEEIMEEVKKPPKRVQLTIHLPSKYSEVLDKASQDMELSREDLAKTVLIDWLVERYV